VGGGPEVRAKRGRSGVKKGEKNKSAWKSMHHANKTITPQCVKKKKKRKKEKKKKRKKEKKKKEKRKKKKPIIYMTH
jgi:hypothetical protein